jgi:hypothetical protein
VHVRGRKDLLISLSLSPWSLGLKQYLRGLHPLSRMLPQGSSVLQLYPASRSDAVLLLAWSYWLLDGCEKKSGSASGDISAVLDCSTCRAIVSTPVSSKSSVSDPESMGHGQILVNGEEQLRIWIAPGESGSVDVRYGGRFIPWIFPEGEGLYYQGCKNGSEENTYGKSDILPGYLIDEVLKFADAVFGK